MPRFASSRVERFADKMSADTIAFLCCFFLVALGMGHTIVSSGVVLKTIDLLGDVAEYLYWDVYWEFCYEVSSNGIPNSIRFLAFLMVCAFVICAYFKFDMGEFKHWFESHPETYQEYLQALAENRQSQSTRKPTTPIVAPVIPPPPMPALPPYPPPFQFPFKNFRGTGESFAHPDRNDPMQYPIYRLPEPWTETRRKERECMSASRRMSATYRSTEDEKVTTAATTSDPEEIQYIKKSAADAMEKSVVVTPAHKVAELPAQPVPAPTPTPPTHTSAPSFGSQATPIVVPLPSLSSSQKIEGVQVPLPIPHVPQRQDHNNGEVMLPLNLPSPEDVRNATISLQLGALALVEGQEHEITTAMNLFLDAIRNGAECEGPAARVLTLMEAAKSHLQKFFPEGLVGLNEEKLIWKDSIVRFWNEFRPYGWIIKENPDEQLRTFLQLFRNIAGWLGLGHCLGDLIVIEPIASPVQKPFQTQQSLPMAQMPSWPTAQQNATPAMSILLPSHPPSYQQPSQHLPQTSLSSTQVPSAPKMQTQFPPSTFTATIQAHPKPTACTSQTTLTNPPPIQQQPAQQSQSVQGAPGLLDFSKDAWLNKSDRELRSLTWRSCQWRNEAEASLKIWSYAVPELTQLPVKHPEFIMASYVKDELEKAAPFFKRAAVVLRIQGRGCEWPDDEILNMVPLMGNIFACLYKAAEMTDKCQEIAVWDSQDEWYQACLYFHKHVIKRDNIWEWLSHRYRSDRVEPLEELWERMTQEWLPDLE